MSESSVVPAASSSRRRTSPAIAGPLLVLLVVVAVVGGGMVLAALPGRDGAVAVASASPRPTRTPVATPRITPSPQPTPTPKPAATPKPAPPTSQPAGNVSGLCEPIFGFPCGLGAGVYQPSGFEPSIRFRLGNGWSTTLAEPDIIGLGRDTGALTFASSPDAVYPSGDPVEAPSSAGRLVDTFVSTDGVTASRPQDGRVDKRKATFVDLTPAGDERIGLFGTSNQTFYLEAHATTRVIVVEVKGSILVIAIEPAESTTLQDVLPAANRVIDSLRFR